MLKQHPANIGAIQEVMQQEGYRRGIGFQNCGCTLTGLHWGLTSSPSLLCQLWPQHVRRHVRAVTSAIREGLPSGGSTGQHRLPRADPKLGSSGNHGPSLRCQKQIQLLHHGNSPWQIQSPDRGPSGHQDSRVGHRVPSSFHHPIPILIRGYFGALIPDFRSVRCHWDDARYYSFRRCCGRHSFYYLSNGARKNDTAVPSDYCYRELYKYLMAKRTRK